MPKPDIAKVTISISSFIANPDLIARTEPMSVTLDVEAPGASALRDKITGITDHTDASQIKQALLAGFTQCDVMKKAPDEEATELGTEEDYDKADQPKAGSAPRAPGNWRSTKAG